VTGGHHPRQLGLRADMPGGFSSVAFIRQATPD
jgi:hypothetical protein